ncbi:uncharacterized protein Gasu_54680 [Galdieria sulphuraria]|uniref:BZIP domain-containing protein n=1 Tax=Galdieria sulphuraria TaxID=130081 RepID=M2WSR0_GALSU|nr:uncharacterized protein Gasu_54680 [Galdieria sulphuraria]EME26895.1 hypothetical protein Gasu_54680 [Galdieria sulphuraria]|eukprot:XP_005703415.1 hypothetical protein Gasu_54680 [Galdieria sulphuraria]
MQDPCDTELVLEEFKPVQRFLSFPRVRKWLFHNVPEEGFFVEGFKKSCVAVEMHPPRLDDVKSKRDGRNLRVQLHSSSNGENCLKLLVPSHFEDGFLFNFVFGELYLVSPSRYVRREFEPFCKRSVYDIESGEVLECIWYQNGIVVLNYARFLTLCQQFYHAFIFAANYEDRTPGKFLESTKLILERAVCGFCGLPGSHCRCHKRFNELVTKHSFISSLSTGASLSLEIPFDILRAIHFGNFRCSLRHYGGKHYSSLGLKFDPLSCPQLEVSISSEMVVREMPKPTFAFLSHRMVQLLLASLGISRLLQSSSSTFSHSSSLKQTNNDAELEIPVVSEAARNRKMRREVLLARRQKRERGKKSKRKDENSSSLQTSFPVSYLESVNDEENSFSLKVRMPFEDKKLRKKIRNREYARESYNRRKARLDQLEAENQSLKMENEMLVRE